MLEEIQAVMGSHIKTLDILYVLEDLKPVSRIMVKDDEYDYISAFLKRMKLNFCSSDFKVAKIDETNYSDKGNKLSLDKPGSYFVYISKSAENAEKAKQFEAKSDHFNLGLILGYPECCTRFFQKNFPAESKANNDYIFPALENSEGYMFSFYTNIIARHLDLNLISHFPCNFSCKASIEVAKKNLECIKKHSADIVPIITSMLKSAVLYTKQRDTYLLRRFRIEGNRLYYDNIFSNVNNDFFANLKQMEFIEIIDKYSVKIGNKLLKDIAFMVFE